MKPISVCLLLLFIALLSAIGWHASGAPLFLVTGLLSCFGGYKHADLVREEGQPVLREKADE